MRTLGMIAGLALLSGNAFAEDKPEAKAEKKEAAAKPPMPDTKPPAEMAKLDNMVGTWKCEGKWHAPADQGGDMDSKSRMVIKKDLDGHWLTGVMSAEKSKNFPGMKENMTWGYDPVNKKYVEMAINSMGGMMHGSADPWDGDKSVWNTEGVMMGKAVKGRTTVTRKGDKEVSIAMEMETEPGKFAPMADTTCKK
jgi:hypothetical protein